MKWILGIIGVIVFIILMIVLVFRRPNQPNTPANQPVSNIASIDAIANTSAQVRYTVQGKLVGEEERRSIRITVARDMRRLEILQGYEEVVIASTDLSNTDAAFQTFLAGLDQAGYNKTKESTLRNEKGVCPQGRRFIFEIVELGEEKQRTWSTSCNNTTGTFAGNRSTVDVLFRGQIPDYNKLVRGTSL